MKTPHLHCLLVVIMAIVALSCSAPNEKSVTAEEARAIAKEAYIYGNPLVDHYRIFYSYFVDESDPEFKTHFNQIKNIPKVYTPADRAVQTPNSDTPYSMGALDLRMEPVVVSVPAIESSRYFSAQMIDGFTHNFYYIGSRTTGNKGGNFLFVGPNWKGEIPGGFDDVIRTETHFVTTAFRTQLFEPNDLDNVIKVQAGYKIQPLSAYLGQESTSAAPAIDFPKPLSKDDQKASLLFFNQLNFWLQFCTIHESERELYDRFSKIGVIPGQRFDPESLSPEIKAAMGAGIQDAWLELEALSNGDIKNGRVTSGDLFGTRAHLQNNYLYRFAGAVLGIYGNSKEEAMYPIYKVDADGQALDASTHRYTLTMQAGELPPVHSFWSVTMYDLPASLLVENPIERYLINSPMLPKLKRNADDSITLYIQNESPGKDKETNWLPAPNGPFILLMRLYWPKDEALNGTWKPAPLVRVQ